MDGFLAQLESLFQTVIVDSVEAVIFFDLAFFWPDRKSVV